MNSKILSILKNIAPTFYQETKQNYDKYIIFSFYNEKDSTFFFLDI